MPKPSPRVCRARKLISDLADLSADDPDLRNKVIDLSRRATEQQAALRRSRRGSVLTSEVRSKAVQNRRIAAEEFRARLDPVLRRLWAAGVRTYRDMADALNAEGIKPPRSNAWRASTVKQFETRMAETAELEDLDHATGE